ncbi:hypothetical protein SRHO_G00329280 [Serrasalmus rhombeus]
MQSFPIGSSLDSSIEVYVHLLAEERSNSSRLVYPALSLHPSINPSTVNRLSESGSRGQQPKQRGPGLPDQIKPLYIKEWVGKNTGPHSPVPS